MTPMNDVAGKVAFITGGSSGIGLGIARACADAGMKVAIGYRTKSNAEKAMTQLSSLGDRVHFIPVEVTDRLSLENAVAEAVRVFSKIHLLVNNAGVQNPSPLLSMRYEDWDRLMSVNVGGIFNGIRAFVPHMKAHGEGGHVLTTSSVVGLCTLGPKYGAYSASKFAAVGMMEALRAELSVENIGVSILCPGPVKSNLEDYLRTFELAADPIDVGRRALRGIQRNDLYILTHPEFNEHIECRHQAILASTPRDVSPNPDLTALVQASLRNSIYVSQPDRHRESGSVQAHGA